jgi:hypothetical protein
VVQSTPDSRASRNFWSPAFRLAAFALAATSIWSLLIEFGGWWSMRSFTIFVAVPALAALFGLALADRTFGTQRLQRATVVGGLAGLIAALGYDGLGNAEDLGAVDFLKEHNVWQPNPKTSTITSQP